MPTYAFRCDDHGPFDRRAPIAEVPDDAPCPTCRTSARRTMTAPALSAPGPGHRIAAAHERSAHAPGVTTSVPGGRTPGAARSTSVPADPRHARLPRP